jgi:hypothetical protein
MPTSTATFGLYVRNDATGRDEAIETGYDAIETALADLRSLWGEDSGTDAVYTVRDKSGDIVATVYRDDAKDDIAMTMYPDLRTVSHRCWYEHDANGRIIPRVVEIV